MDNIKLIPIGDRVIIKPVIKETKTESGIILSLDKEQEKPGLGIIVAVGDNRIMKEGGSVTIEVAVGDMVMYAKYVGEEILHNGETFMVVRNDSLLAKILK